jgi:hypothetical protein
MGYQPYGQEQRNESKHSRTRAIRAEHRGKVWQDVATYLREAIEKREFIVFTQRAMTERGKGKDAPRWKHNPVDVLSWFLFLLKVPVVHELVQLWQTIDWRAINRIAGAAYKAAQRQRFVSEGRFGLAKMNHNGARASYRSDEMNHIAGLMIAIVVDYRILARHQQSIEKAA